MKRQIEKLSLAKCKTALNRGGVIYSDSEIIMIRDFLYRLAELDYEVFLKMKNREMDFENEKQNEAENSELKDAA